jgi:hypothetical protein
LQGYDARSQENARNIEVVIEVVMDKTMVIVLRILLYFENDCEDGSVPAAKKCNEALAILILGKDTIIHYSLRT